MPAAASNAATPSQKTIPTIRFTIVVPALSCVPRAALSAPSFALDRLRGQKQAERDEAEVINQVRGVDDTLREVVEVIDDRQIGGEFVAPGADEAADPGDD